MLLMTDDEVAKPTLLLTICACRSPVEGLGSTRAVRRMGRGPGCCML